MEVYEAQLISNDGNDESSDDIAFKDGENVWVEYNACTYLLN